MGGKSCTDEIALAVQVHSFSTSKEFGEEDE